MEPIQPLINAAIAKVLQPAPLTPEKVVFAWRVAVGAAVARVTRVRLAGDGHLQVDVDDDRFGGELDRSASMVLQRMRHLLGDTVVARMTVHRPAPRTRRRRGPQAAKPLFRSHEGETS